MQAMVKIGSRLREVRVLRALTQEQLAGKAGLGTNTVARIERDETEPHMTSIRKLATALDVDPAELISEREFAG